MYKSMSRNPKIILSEIKTLVYELETSFGGRSSPQKKTTSKSSSPMVVPKGAMGAITMLIEDGFFNTPKDISLIMERLKEIGHYHKKPAISMNLLNLSKRRVMNRFENKETKNWEYVIRK